MKTLRHIGLKMGIVRLVAHKQHWHKVFKKEKKAIQKLLVDGAIEIRHVGSTSIPQMPAKPIIDITVRVKNKTAALDSSNKLKKLGYAHRKKGDKRGIIFLARGKKPDVRVIHLTLIYLTRPWNEITLFRDYLHKNKREAKKYHSLKLKLAKQFPNNPKAYTHGKDKFIKRIVKLARKQR